MRPGKGGERRKIGGERTFLHRPAMIFRFRDLANRSVWAPPCDFEDAVERDFHRAIAPAANQALLGECVTHIIGNGEAIEQSPSRVALENPLQPICLFVAQLM